MRFQVINNYATTLEAAIGTGDTELDLASVSGLPAGGDIGTNFPVPLTLVPEGAQNPSLSEVEVVHVTGVDQLSGTATVTRGEDGTSAKAWDSGTPVEGRLPAGVVNQFLQAVPWGEQKQANANVSPNGFWLSGNGAGTDKGPESSNAVVIGAYSRANASYALATGYGAEATAFGAWAIGYSAEASGTYALSFGQGNVASGYASQALGGLVNATADYALAEGYKTRSYAKAAHAEGYDTEVSSKYGHAEGWSSVASGDASHSEGRASEAAGAYSHAEGYETQANEKSAHAEGYYSNASGVAAHAEGKRTVAEGNYSRAGGYGGYAMQAYADSQGSHFYQSASALTNHVALRQPLTAQTSDDSETAMTPGMFLAKPQYGPYNAGSAFSFAGRVVASGGGYAAHWTLEAFGVHSGAYVTIESSAVTKEDYTGGASAWSLALRAYQSKLYVDVTGAAATDIDWSGVVYGAQVNKFTAP